MLDCVACKEKRNNYNFYINLYDFKNCSAFVNIKLCIKEFQQIRRLETD